MLTIPDTRGFAYESMGTQWRMTIWDDIDAAALSVIEAEVIRRSTAFDALYSRFKKTSLIWTLVETTGVTEVPQDLVRMLRLYETLHDLSGGKCNPLVGFALSDMGYDAEYSLKAQETIRPVPNFHDAVRIVDDTHIDMLQPALIDVGALGKGYFVDLLSTYLVQQGIRRFLVDGSGDILYHGDGHSIRAGLEHPADPTKVIGVVEMTDGALCASSGNRRIWAGHNHIIDPHTLVSPEAVIATWVMAPTAALADGLATCLFFTDPSLYAQFPFEYCILNSEYRAKQSKGFAAELF
jgi:thiamine biosynthesis lipoprotein